MKIFLILAFILCVTHINAQKYAQKIDFEKLNIQFEHASDQLKPEYIPLIYRLADSLVKNPNLHVIVRGHVCCVKRNKLAKRRAKTVRNYLYLFGVYKSQVSILGMKNTMPVVFPEKTKEDELANMRVDFIFSKQSNPH